ncbi:zf-HC2 domain-containing protein [Paenibacillus sp. JX-17]|uniref:Anti-sigma-W factor RsiW n=1 Tax=Paenibacillus lacisoli TaxID=3064525 RepID=A0ABT9C8E2_9BACL|nr:zf-HC2 domain-containing protein [Paenibacillus sp. JX-17]MDO7905491.1 zf-HC2 domain-containing protein [Paenibacillus sp. JX-17]
MRCQEMEEWMNRYLDHDLNQEETAELLRHTAECPACAEKFQILRALSRELEDLPQVKPRFSLVDAIMPQLDAIDEAKREQGSALQEMKPVAAVTDLGARARDRKPSWFNSMVGRAVLGTAAAAAVLGIAILNYEPHTVQDAEALMEQNTASQDTARTGSAGSSVDRSITDGNATMKAVEPDPEDKDSSEPASVQTGQESDAKESPDHSEPKKSVLQDQPDVTKESKPSEDSAKASSSAPASSDGSNRPSASSEPAESPKPARSQSAENKKTVESTPSTGELSKSEKAAPKTGAADTKDQAKADDSDQAALPEMSIQSSPEGNQQPSADVPTAQQQLVPPRGITAPSTDSAAAGESKLKVAEEDPFKSPDGQYVVKVEGRKLTVYQLASDDTGAGTAIEVRDLAGTWSEGSWSKDSKVFTYKIQQDGVTSTLTYTVPTPNKTP